jgi:hypothetical protein
MDDVRRAVDQAWQNDHRVLIAGVDSIIRGRYYFDHLIDFLRQGGMPPFERVATTTWGKIRLVVLRPAGRPPAGTSAFSWSPHRDGGGE